MTRIRTMEEFANRSGLSRPTVSKYFQDPGSVRPSTRTRIEAALETYDYRPNLYAINQNRRLTKTIGVLVPLLSDPFFSKMARTIERLCVDAGFRPILLSANGEAEREVENLRTLLSLKPAGLLLAPLGRGSDAEAVAALAREVPCVLFDSDLGGVGGGYVGLDVEDSVSTMVDYLCRGGAAPCLFEMRDAPNPNARRRRAAFVAAMDRLGHDPHVIAVDGRGWDFEETGLREGGALIARRALPDTVLCSNDRLAIGLLAAAYQSGLRVGIGPGCALRIAGHDDHPFARYTCPPLTTISQDYEAIAGRAVEILMEAIDGDGPPATREGTLFRGRLVMRASA